MTDDRIGFKVDGTRIVVDAELLLKLVQEVSRLEDRIQRLYTFLGLKD